MQTTVTLDLDAELLAQAEKLAHDLGITLDELVTRLLENYIRQHAQPNNPGPLLSREEFEVLKGIIHLSPEDEQRGYRDIVTEERAKKYGLL